MPSSGVRACTCGRGSSFRACPRRFKLSCLRRRVGLLHRLLAASVPRLCRYIRGLQEDHFRIDYVSGPRFDSTPRAPCGRCLCRPEHPTRVMFLTEHSVVPAVRLCCSISHITLYPKTCVGARGHQTLGKKPLVREHPAMQNCLSGEAVLRLAGGNSSMHIPPAEATEGCSFFRRGRRSGLSWSTADPRPSPCPR